MDKSPKEIAADLSHKLKTGTGYDEQAFRQHLLTAIFESIKKDEGMMKELGIKPSDSYRKLILHDFIFDEDQIDVAGPIISGSVLVGDKSITFRVCIANLAKGWADTYEGHGLNYAGLANSARINIVSVRLIP